ncbi:hypothetical protein NO263_07515 [Gluconacetobacter entanii]|uniref:Uncharacterized protein n=1 Tax=Gluconacetobacter entanii TaxID=108528 RepID=A0ABT3K4V1_9PROT|nr:hypothetical protein [Gluconacetobacter entanii]MCW4590424.1 hypothetical protein [Gluconacetobacter entanii]MCW4594344.1 hypothetical protein [Gluconacetobacter entanii]NPC88169.1 hypothetical protein [Gluconacetobacter entanii]
MARKSIEYTVTSDGEDNGKVFVITRMSAFEADKWGRHVLQAAIRSGAAIPDTMVANGIAGLAGAGISIFGAIDPDTTDRLLSRLMECVQIRRDPAHPEVVQKLLPVDIEEIETVATLQKEAFMLHVGFFRGAARLFSPLVGQMAPGLAAGQQSAPTSPGPSPAS